MDRMSFKDLFERNQSHLVMRVLLMIFAVLSLVTGIAAILEDYTPRGFDRWWVYLFFHPIVSVAGMMAISKKSKWSAYTLMAAIVGISMVQCYTHVVIWTNWNVTADTCDTITDPADPCIDSLADSKKAATRIGINLIFLAVLVRPAANVLIYDADRRRRTSRRSKAPNVHYGNKAAYAR